MKNSRHQKHFQYFVWIVYTFCCLSTTFSFVDIRVTQQHSIVNTDSPSILSLTSTHYPSSATSNDQETKASKEQQQQQQQHVVDGIQCRTVGIDIPMLGIVTVLEATAESQEDLVNMALEIEEDDNVNDNHNNMQQQQQSNVQLLNVGDPYGAVLWPAAWAVANYLIESSRTKTSHKDNNAPISVLLKGCRILELGTGTGLVSLAAAMAGADHVIASDYETVALDMTNYAATNLNNNFLKNSKSNILETRLLDMCEFDKHPLPKDIDIVVAADIMYEPKTGIAMAHRAVEALKNNCRVIIGDSPGRPGRPAFLKTLQELGVQGATFHDTIGRTCTGPRHDLICGQGSTSVSDVPKDLSVAIMELDPELHIPV